MKNVVLLKQSEEGLIDYSEVDLDAARKLATVIKILEKSIFKEKAGFILCKTMNSYDVEAMFYPQDLKYDIYLPHLKKKIKEVNPNFCFQSNLVIEACHKIRHRVVYEGKVSPFTQIPSELSHNFIELKQSQCCLSVEDKLIRESLEFDWVVAYNHIINEFKYLFKRNIRVFDIPLYFWKKVANSILIETQEA